MYREFMGFWVYEMRLVIIAKHIDVLGGISLIGLDAKN
jgi:hypothetical protein